MGSNFSRLLGAALLLPLLVCGVCEAQAIPWRAGAEPLPRTKALPADGLAVVQLERPPSPGDRRALAGAGITLLGYLAENAWFARVAPTTKRLPNDAALKAITAPKLAWKLHPALLGNEEATRRVVYVQLQPDIDTAPGC